jgi:hypothetical protein
MKSEFDDLENSTVALAQKFNESIEEIQSETSENEEPVRKPSGGTGSAARGRKRKRGTDLTLDD